ncbi:TPA: DsbC family protein [Kluyvera ascorbata]|nr:DsbC family protein [Kluyvera ascorbata]
MNQNKTYSVVKNGNTITVMYSQDGSIPQTLNIFHEPQMMRVEGNQLLGLYPGSSGFVTLLNDPEHDAQTVLNTVAQAQPVNDIRTSPAFKGLALAAIGALVATAVWALPYTVSVIPNTPPSLQVAHEALAPATPPPGLLPSEAKAAFSASHQDMQEALASNRTMLPETPTAALKAGNIKAMAAVATPTPAHTGSTLSPRLQMADVLKRNAARGMFTITLSEGHPRTLYAFLDPTCSVCRQMEPAIETLAQQYNVIVFPVSVVNDGGDAVKRIIPLLCQKDPIKRAAGWQNAFRADAGMHMPGAPEANEPVDAACAGAAEAAVGVNNLGFRQFGFGGTPWVLTDTGFHLPTGMLSRPDKIGLFLDTTDGMAPEQADQFMTTINTEG